MTKPLNGNKPAFHEMSYHAVEQVQRQLRGAARFARQSDEAEARGDYETSDRLYDEMMTRQREAQTLIAAHVVRVPDDWLANGESQPDWQVEGAAAFNKLKSSKVKLLVQLVTGQDTQESAGE